ncbi:FG-GAP-like repeat-containing protein [Streptomyces sp. NPDC050504]|uniref:FG-GAP-like repeat-containing protein n=1 Tax=Streptomyces sp. NPDC050504 TaxID=3365618 RepID=UPI0037AB75CE
MIRHRSALRRAAATAVVLSVGAGLCAVTAPAALADPAAPDSAAPGASADGGAVVPAGTRFLPRADRVTEATRDGYLHRQEGRGGLLWTDYASGETKQAVDDHSRGHDGLRASEKVTKDADGAVVSRTVTITELVTGKATEVPLPDGHRWASLVFTADEVLAYRVVDGLLTAPVMVDAQGTARPVTGIPQGVAFARTLPEAQDGRGAVLTLGRTAENGGTTAGLLDFATGRVTELPRGFASTIVVMGERHVLRAVGGHSSVLTIDRADPTAAPVSTPLPEPSGPEMAHGKYGSVGDWILVAKAQSAPAKQYRAGGRLLAVPVGGGEPRELLRHAHEALAQTADGRALVTGGTGANDWAVREVKAAPGGVPELTTVRKVEPVVAKIEALALGGGRLSFLSAADAAPDTGLYEQDFTPGGALSGSPVLKYALFNDRATGLRALGDGSSAYSNGSAVVAPISRNGLRMLDAPGELIDATGRYTVSNGPDGKQRIGDMKYYGIELTRAASAASVWGATLWKPGAKAGTVSWTNLATKKNSVDFPLGSGCAPSELQAVGRWIYWACGAGGKAGVWDQKTRTSTAVPSGEALLGDGFLVRNDSAAGKLMLTDFHTGTGPAKTSAFAEVPAGAGRGTGWTVDKFGGGVAYVDAQQRVHVRPVTVPRSSIGPVESDADIWVAANSPRDDENTWNGSWLLSRPAARWSVTVKDAAGRTVRTLSGASATPDGARIKASWDVKDAGGKRAAGGTHSWTLSVDPGDGTGARTAGSGKFTVTGGATPYRDLDGNGVPELIAKRGAELTSHEEITDRTGTSGRVVTGSGGWAGVTAVVPFGDLDGDGCNDLVVRDTKGELSAVSGKCVGLPSAKAPRVRIGAGFNSFDVLTTAGDMTGDGLPDLVARQRATGDVYLYATTATGRLKPGVKIASKWTGYRAVIGAGDLNGDGVGDLLAVDRANSLWRFDGTKSGALKPGALVYGKNWGVNRAEFVGVGDVTGDGRADLISRRPTGELLRNAGDGKGSFGGTVQVGAGWQQYGSIH